MTGLPFDIPLKKFHLFHGAKIAEFAGYNMPINYKSGIINEHKNVRNTSGIFDISHMGQIIIPNNKDNINNLKKYIPLDFNKLKINKSYYSFLLNNNGGIIDDVIISNIISENVRLIYIVYNASRKNIDQEIFNNITTGSKVLKNNCLFSIQGPDSFNILNKIIKISKNMKFFDIIPSNYNNENILISRSGYTGEDGFEISIPIIISELFLKNLLKDNKTSLCGLGSRDSLRLEAGLSLYGNEIDEKITPIEAGLSWAIDKERLHDNELNGYEYLLKQIKNNPSRKKIGIIAVGKSMIRKGMIILDKYKNKIGMVTSGCFSPNLNKSIGIGYINYKFDLKNEIYCEIRNKLELVEEKKLPFIKKNYKK